MDRGGICTTTELTGVLQTLGLTHARPVRWRLSEVSIPIPVKVHSAFKVGLMAASVKQAMVSVTGFEPVVSWSQATRFTKLSYTLMIGGLYGN